MIITLPLGEDTCGMDVVGGFKKINTRAIRTEGENKGATPNM